MSDKELYEKLTIKSEPVYKIVDSDEMTAVSDFSQGYKAFLNNAKTEREATSLSEKLAIEAGFSKLDSFDTLKPGDKVYVINRNKNILLAVIGTEDIENGLNLVGAHIDAPRLDLKQNPLYEKNSMAFLKTHYYGGIKKYQWTAIPLSLHGVVHKTDGEMINIVIGEDENDPVFTITDLLPHLADDQMKKPMYQAVEGEALRILFGGYGIGDDEVSENVKFNILKLLNDKYGIDENSFFTAEIEIVPAFKASDVGLDRAFIGSYAQDDRVCAYTALQAVLEVENPYKTAVCLLIDKEEIGSMGNTGMKSAFFRYTVAEIAQKCGGCDLIKLNRILTNTQCLSADVGAAVDPMYDSVTEPGNSAYAGKGLLITKYTGARGKSGSSDANAEFVGKVVKLFNDSKVVWQTGELGKVDGGGGGTIAQYVANLNIDVIDCGVPILSMHSPFEISAKTDVYMAYKGYKAFYLSK